MAVGDELIPDYPESVVVDDNAEPEDAEPVHEEGEDE